jgi:hypothetical protein
MLHAADGPAPLRPSRQARDAHRAFSTFRGKGIWLMTKMAESIPSSTSLRRGTATVRLRCVALACLAISLTLVVGLALGGCERLLQLNDITPAPPPGMDNGYVCNCTCTYADGGTSSTGLNVCVPPSLNPNLPGGTVPSAADLRGDCGSTATSRVLTEVQKMSNKCYTPNPTCVCDTATPNPQTFYNQMCDNGCVPMPLDANCDNWDPPNGNVNANCATPTLCADPGPVCLSPTNDPTAPTPSPLAAGIMARDSNCTVNGAVDGSSFTLASGDQSQTSPLVGVVRFSCSSGQACAMNYFFTSTKKLSFSGVLGFDTDFENIVTVGASAPFTLDASGASSLPGGATQSSGRGTQTETNGPFPDNVSHPALVGTNTDAVAVTFDGSTCSIQGDLVGQVGDSSNSSDFTVALNVSGTVDNNPPHASLGSDRNVECTSPTGADVVLDGTSSTDAENNIVSYAWFLGSRAGTVLGTGSTLTVHQALGAQTYVVKAIDAYMEADEASATITVVDSTGPTVACNAPATITPRKTPYSFTATAADTCGSTGTPAVLDFTCFALNSAGQQVTRECSVKISGATFTILDSGGIGNVLRWRVRAADAHGNSTITTCQTQIVHP